MSGPTRYPALAIVLLLSACATTSDMSSTPAQPGTPVARDGTEIMVCGQLYRTGTPVVLWFDPGGYDAYRPYRFFGDGELPSRPAAGCDTPSRLSRSGRAIDGEVLAREVEQQGWDLERLGRQVDLFVIHYDVTWASKQCFKVLHDIRGLSVHFLLDQDGTIYQTCDLKERARHAGSANDRSIGIEIAHIGPITGRPQVAARYHEDEQGPWLDIPDSLGPQPFRTKGYLPRPARPEPIVGTIQGQRLEQYDFTEEQYRALARLAATLCAIFPRLPADYPRGPDGGLETTVLSPERLETYHGWLGHYHVTKRKIDPGPAFDWERLRREARSYLPQ